MTAASTIGAVQNGWGGKAWLCLAKGPHWVSLIYRPSAVRESGSCSTENCRAFTTFRVLPIPLLITMQM